MSDRESRIRCVDIIDAVADMFGLAVTTVSLHDAVLYADFFPNASALAVTPLRSLVDQVSATLDASDVPHSHCLSSVSITILAENGHRENVPLPVFKITWS